jgi:hypothetical protein
LDYKRPPPANTPDFAGLISQDEDRTSFLKKRSKKLLLLVPPALSVVQRAVRLSSMP